MPYTAKQMSGMQFEPSTLNREMGLKGLTPEGLAKEAGVSTPTVYKALRGELLKLRSATRILVALGRIPSVAVPDDLVKAS